MVVGVGGGRGGSLHSSDDPVASYFTRNENYDRFITNICWQIKHKRSDTWYLWRARFHRSTRDLVRIENCCNSSSLELIRRSVAGVQTVWSVHTYNQYGKTTTGSSRASLSQTTRWSLFRLGVLTKTLTLVDVSSTQKRSEVMGESAKHVESR